MDRVIGGPAKRSRVYTPKEKRLVAYHEAGHAIVGMVLDSADKVQKVTIIPRGDAGGYNLMIPEEENTSNSYGFNRQNLWITWWTCCRANLL